MATDRDEEPSTFTPAERGDRLAEAFCRALNDGDVESIEEYHAADLDFNPSDDESRGREDLKDVVREYLTAFPDISVSVQETLVDGETVCVRYQVTGHHRAWFRGVAPTHEEMSAHGIAFAEYDDGQIAEFSLVFDNLGMLADMGLVG